MSIAHDTDIHILLEPQAEGPPVTIRMNPEECGRLGQVCIELLLDYQLSLLQDGPVDEEESFIGDMVRVGGVCVEDEDDDYPRAA